MSNPLPSLKVIEQIHLVVRESEDGRVYATSPQAPGLAYGRESIADLRRDLTEVLSFHLDRPGPFDLVEHRERHFEIADRELVIRLALDEHQAERRTVRERLGQALSLPEQAGTLLTGAPTPWESCLRSCRGP